jgi:hypothetical protein
MGAPPEQNSIADALNRPRQSGRAKSEIKFIVMRDSFVLLEKSAVGTTSLIFSIIIERFPIEAGLFSSISGLPEIKLTPQDSEDRVVPSARFFQKFCICLFLILSAARVTNAQLNGLHIKGDAGLDSGSQAPPGAYWGTFFYWYDTGRINNGSGDQINANGSLDAFAGAPLVSVVTKKKFLGANYGFLIIPASVLNSSLDAPRFGQNPSAGFGHTYFQPVNLGWKFNRADVVAGFAIYAPTGRYTADNPNGDNTGLGMWGFEPSIGATVHLNEAKTWNASALASFEFNTDKRDTSEHVGNLLTLEGGVGRSFLHGAAKAGLAYYAQWKLSEDTLEGFPPLLVVGKNRAAALGPELTIPLATKSTLYGFFTFR